MPESSLRAGLKAISSKVEALMDGCLPMEKRSFPHNGAQITVACSGLIANSPVLKGKMLDCSCMGTCIQLSQRIQEGSIVMIKATVRKLADNSSILPEGFRSFSLAEVKWSKPLEDEGLFAIGLKYLPS